VSIAKVIQTVREKQEKDASEKEEWLEESPAVVLGTQGIYGIVYGLGISEALNGYVNLLSSKSNNLLYSAPLGMLGTVGLFFPDTFRLVGFLITIIPFIHGAILTFSNKWYYNKTEKNYHFGVAFIFFIMVFAHSALFFFVALNIHYISLFLLLLWS
jgi:hypothetical protein